MTYSTLVQKETAAALLYILENQGIAEFAKCINMLYSNIDPDILDEISEEIYGRTPLTAVEATSMYEPELKYIYR